MSQRIKQAMKIELTLLSDNSYSALVEELWTNLKTDWHWPRGSIKPSNRTGKRCKEFMNEQKNKGINEFTNYETILLNLENQ